MKRLLPLLLAVLVLTACHRKGVPDDVLPPDTMAAFLADAYLLEGFYAIETQFRYDVVTDRVLHAYDSILDLHGTSRQQMERSFDYYASHLDLYQSIQDSAVALLERRDAASFPDTVK